MAIALTLLRLGVNDRRLWLYDTFGSMPPAGEHDRDYAGRQMGAGALDDVNNSLHTPGLSVSEVRRAMASTGYPPEHVMCVEGLVEETIARSAPERIALLRLDTDWYESTRHELVELYPRLEHGGVLLIDDYGHFAGARKAVDEYFAGIRFSSAGSTTPAGWRSRSEPPLSVEISSPSSLARAFTVRSCLSLSVFVFHRGSDSETIGVPRPRSRELKSMPRPLLRSAARAPDRSRPGDPTRRVRMIDPARSP